jgi:hypothetical protein
VREFSEAVQGGNILAAREALYAVELLLPEKSLAADAFLIFVIVALLLPVYDLIAQAMTGAR